MRKLTGKWILKKIRRSRYKLMVEVEIFGV
jgi:hypothetical protein